MNCFVDEKLLALGQMVFQMLTDVVVLSANDPAYARKTITFPDGRGGKGSIELILARKPVADIMEKSVIEHFSVTDIDVTGGKPV